MENVQNFAMQRIQNFQIKFCKNDEMRRILQKRLRHIFPWYIFSSRKQKYIKENKEGSEKMIKGINRQVVEVKDTGSECFERILFFVKPEYAGISEGKIRERAGLVAKGAALPPPTKLKKSLLREALKITAAVLAGMIIGICLSMLLG